MEAAVMYWNDTPEGPADDLAESETEVRWDIDPDAESLELSWPFLGLGNDDVHADPALTEIPKSPRSLSIFAAGDIYGADGPSEFDEHDLDALQPGEVLMLGVTEDDGFVENVAVSARVFANLDCSYFDDE